MRKYIIVALLLVAAGIGVSFFLLPNADDVRIAQARDQQTIDMGNIDVEAEYNQGRRSYQIINALAEKRVAEGKKDEAVKLWEEYVAANPVDAPGRKKLAEYYQSVGRQADYNAQLEAIANTDPTEANLSVLASVYNADKNYPKQVEVLKKLVEVTKGENPNYFADLATMQTATGDKEGALATLATLKDKHPTFNSYAITRIKVTILSEQGKTDEAFAEAKNWIDSSPVPTTPTVVPLGVTPDAVVSAPPTQSNKSALELADLGDILHYSGHADKAIELIQPHEAWIDTSSELAVSYVNANITAGQTEYAYNLLAGIEAKGNMVPALYIPYMQLALKKGDVPAAENIARSIRVEEFNEEQALNIVEVTRLANADTVLAVLEERFGTEVVLKDKPVLAAVLAILTNAKDQDTRIETALNAELSSLQRLRLAESCARAQKTACFDAILAQYPSVDQQTTPQTVEYAQLYIIANRPADVIDAVGLQAAKPDAHPDVVLAHVRLGAAAGRKDITTPWLEANTNLVPIQRLQDLFFLASDRKHNDVSTDVAERLYARDPSPMNRDLLVAALVAGNNYSKALPLVREQMAQGGADDSMYIATLTQAARKDADARKELADYAEAQLKAGKGDDKQQLNYAYVLLNNGRKETVMPYVNAYAKDRGGEWKRMQQQLTLKPGAPGAAVKALSREQRVAMAANPKMSDDNKRAIAFSLLNDGHKADALTIFKNIAANKAPDSKEVKDLLYIWGGKVNAEQLAWIKQRSANASPYDKEKWAELINTYGDDQAVVQYVSDTPDALYSPALRKKYFRVLAQSGKQYYDEGMRNWVAQTTDVPALLDYANTGMAFSFQNAALNGYRRVEQLDPNNAKALDTLALLTYGKGKFTEAAPYIDRAIVSAQNSPSADIDPAQARYLKAEMLKRAGNVSAAQQEYSAVIQYTQQVPTQEPSKLSRMYIAMFNTGQHSQAMSGYNNLLAAYPDDKGILADYMSALIEFKYYDEATRVANQYDKNSPHYGRGATLTGESRNVSSIERLSEGREMRISFNKPTEDAMPIDQAEVQKLAWLERSEIGYDTLTVSAKPGYVVRYVPTANDQFAVVSMPVEQVSPQVSAQRQQDLRLQLLYAQIERETGQPERAQQRLLALQQYYPQDSQLLATRASVESAAGNRSEAIALVQQAQLYNPDNEDLARMERDISYVQRATTGKSAQFVKLDGEYRSYGASDEYITTLSGMMGVGDDNEIGFMVQNDSITPNNGFLDPATGGIANDSVNHQQVELLMAHYFENGNRLQGSLFADASSQIGAGVYYAFANRLGRTELLGEYHKPYWDYASAVNAYANRDRVGFRHFASLSENNSLGVEMSANNYNIEFGDDQVQTGLFRVSLSHQIQPKTEDQPYLGVGYGFDGEYKLGSEHKRRNGVFGSYKPFDWTDREVHFLSGMYQDDWTPTTHALLVAGYAIDRLGEGGPSAEARVTQDLSDQWELGVRGHYGFQAQEAENDAVNVGAHLMYKF